MSTVWSWAEAPPTRWRMRSCSQAVCSGRDSGYHTPGHSQKGLPAHSGGHQWALICPRWQFASDGGDIGFGVFLKTRMGERQKAGEMVEVLPSQRYNAHMVPEDGSLTCSEAGVCKSTRALALETGTTFTWFKGLTWAVAPFPRHIVQVKTLTHSQVIFMNSYCVPTVRHMDPKELRMLGSQDTSMGQ